MFNKFAGHGDWLIVNVRIWDEEFPFIVDSGCPASIVDHSLESRLGQRVGSTRIHHFNGISTCGLYNTPEIFLAGTRLKTGRRCLVVDLKEMSPGFAVSQAHPMGILGMDCLRNYCIQLDFETERMRFLPPGQVDASQFDKSFSIKFPSRSPQLENGSLIGQHGASIDTGFMGDGMLEPELFKRTGAEKSPDTQADGRQSALIPKIIWNKATYTNLFVYNGVNVIGLDFLARHRVVLDFPNGKMYLKQSSVGPLYRPDAESIVELLKSGQIPGIPKGKHGNFDLRFTDACAAEIEAHRENDPSVYHYKIIRASFEAPWTMQRGWRTDKNGRTVEEYSTPHTGGAK